MASASGIATHCQMQKLIHLHLMQNNHRSYQVFTILTHPKGLIHRYQHLQV